MAVTYQQKAIVPQESSRVAPNGAAYQPAKNISGSERTFPTIANLVAHYDARYINGLSGTNPPDGAAISQWNDLSGNGNHAIQATGTAQPLLRSSNKNLLTYNQATVEYDTTGLGAIARCTVSRSTTSAAHGLGSLLLTCNSTGRTAAGISTAPSYTIPVYPGGTYTFTAKARIISGTNQTAQNAIRWYDGANQLISEPGGSSHPSITNAGWTSVTMTATAPAGAVKAAPYVTFENGINAETYAIDELGFWEGDSTTWAPPVSIQNNNPTAQFQEGQSKMSIPALTSTATASRTMYFVLNLDTDSATLNRSVFEWTQRQRLYWDYTTEKFAWNFVDGTGFVGGPTPSASSPPGPYYVVSAMVNVPTQQAILGVNNTEASTTLSRVMTDARGAVAPEIGVLDSNTRWSGTISSIMIYNATHDLATRQAIVRSLGSQYGITVA